MKEFPLNLSLVTDDIFKIFVEHTVDGLLVIDSEGVVQYANPAAKSMFGDKTGELLGSYFGIPAIDQPVELVLPTQGELRYVEMVAAEVSWQGKEATLAGLRDVTERKRSEMDLAEALDKFRGLVEQQIAGIFIIQDGRVAYVNPRCAEILGQGSADDLIGSDPLTWIVEADRADMAEKLLQLEKREVRSVAVRFGVVRRDGKLITIGANGASATHMGRPAVVGLLQDISEKVRTEEEIRNYIAQLKAGVKGAAEVAMTMGEMRDPYTAGHERRVGHIAVAIGKELGLDADCLEGLLVAGMLHDVGKITVPSEILARPGKLAPMEFELIKGHPQAGYDILKHVMFEWPVAEVALQHHERMDGSGYPQGLKGDEILLEARITAVADVIEAMSSHRPYRAGLGIDKALAEIEQGRGITYDTLAADACLRLFRDKDYTIPD